MSFDWLSFLVRYGIEHTTEGPNTGRGNVSVRCPFCVDGDPSMHLGISLEGRGWNCWRVKAHRGRAPHRLVMGLLGCSYGQAATIVGTDTYVPEDFLSRVESLLGKNESKVEARTLKLPAEFKPFTSLPSSWPYTKYLRGRGFTDLQIGRMTETYDLHYATRGLYRGRIIFPIYMYDRLCSWTARSIWQESKVRYMTHTDDGEKAREQGYDPALGPTSDYLLWYDLLMDNRRDADTLIVHEGPFDALKVNVLGRRHHVIATCLFTSKASAAQIELLHEVSRHYRHRYVVLDPEMFGSAVEIARQLAALRFRAVPMPDGVEDPGAFRPNTFENFLTCL